MVAMFRIIEFDAVT